MQRHSLTVWFRNLMAKDDFKNLGFREANAEEQTKAQEDAGAKGELRW